MLVESSTTRTPEFVFFIIPLTALIAVMVTIGALTKTASWCVMQACGIASIVWRGADGVLAVAASASMLMLQDRVLPYSKSPRAGIAPREAAAARRAPST